MDLFKGKGHKQFTAAYVRMWAALVQTCYELDLLLMDPLLDRIGLLSTGLSRCCCTYCNKFKA